MSSDAISGPDDQDVSCVPSKLDFDAASNLYRPPRRLFSQLDESSSGHCC